VNVNLSGIVDGGAMRSLNGTQSRGGRNSQRENIIQARQQEQQRELELRQKEDERIAVIKDRMAEVSGDRELTLQMRTAEIDLLTHRIKQIHQARTDRETARAELEAIRNQVLIEEATAPENRRNEDDETYENREEAEEARNRVQIDGLTRIAVGMDNLSVLRQTRASLVSELGHLERAMDSPNSNTIKIGIVAHTDVLEAGQGVFISQHFGRGVDDFRNHHASRLNKAIGRTNVAINMAVADMYRESARLQENQLGDYHEREEQVWESPTEDE